MTCIMEKVVSDCAMLAT